MRQDLRQDLKGRIQVSTWMPTEMMQEVDNERGDVTRSLWFRRAIQMYLDHSKNTKKISSLGEAISEK